MTRIYITLRKLGYYSHEAKMRGMEESQEE